MYRWIPATIVETEPLVEFLTGVDGQQAQLQLELSRPVLDDTDQVDQFSIQIIVDLKLIFRLSQQDRAGAAKDFDVTGVFQWEYGVKDRQQTRCRK